MEDLAQQAIQAAIRGDWHSAERLNRRILTSNPNDIESMLRLANAASQLAKVKEANAMYNKILALDPHNVFASRGLFRLKLTKGESGNTSSQHNLHNSFLEEPGKTKTVSLVKPAYSDILARLDTGEQVLLTPRRRRLTVTMENGTYIGRLPDDLSMRLLGFIRGGNEYDAAVKSVNAEQIKIFIRETVRSPRFQLTPSFPPETITSNDEEK